MMISASLLSSLALATAPADWTWTKTDTAAEVAVAGVSLLDWGQTRWVSEHPRYRECNPFLGSHPSRLQVDAWFAGSIAAHALIARALPSPYRRWFQAISLGWEAAFVGRNAQLGVGFSF